jgi:DNA polymerase (family 10)
MNKEAVAAVLAEIGVLLELKGENPFKTRAYANAARTVEGLIEPLDRLVAEGRLGGIKGIGEALGEKIATLVRTGRLPYHEELKASVPAGLLEMLQIPSLGPKKVKALYERLGVGSVADLERACRAGRVAGLDGFGEKTQQKILDGIEFRRQYAARHLLIEAVAVAEPILEALRGHPAVIRCSTAGSVRRFKEVIGDVDFLVSTREPAAVLDFFTTQSGVTSVSARGETKASVILAGGIQADLRVVSEAEYPFALAYFTGSKEHNIVLRQRAIQRGLRLNEYGLFRAQAETRDPALRLECRTEEEIHAALGLAPIPPELREDRGEVEAAEAGVLPRLVDWSDLRGSLHNHSNWSDGRDTLEAIAEQMRGLGFAYWAITDHSKSSFQANGLDATRLRAQLVEVRRINEGLAEMGVGFRLLSGIEVDILREGLDLPDDVLAEVDLVVASLHVAVGDGAENTRRLIRAAQNRQVHMLAHPSGRLLLEREAYPVDMPAVIEACGATATWIELNCNPYRYDLDWRFWRQARDRGVKCAINCDAHGHAHAGFLRLGAGLARKGWLRREDVVNTLPLSALRAALGVKRALGADCRGGSVPPDAQLSRGGGAN